MDSYSIVDVKCFKTLNFKLTTIKCNLLNHNNTRDINGMYYQSDFANAHELFNICKNIKHNL